MRARPQLAIERRPSFLFYLERHCGADLAFRALAQPFGRELAGSPAQAMADVIAMNKEVLTVAGSAAQHDMAVRMTGVPMINGHPVQGSADIRLGPAHQLASEVAQL